MFRRYFLLVASLLCYASVLFPPDVLPIAVLAAYAIPGVVVLNAILFLVFIIFRPKRAVRPLIAMIAGVPFIISSIQWSVPSRPTEESFTVMSFNAKLFRRPGSYREFSMEMIEWTVQDTSDIKAIPEHSTDGRWEPLDVDRMIKEQGYNSYSIAAPIPFNEHNLGSAIFSKFQVSERGVVFTDSTSISLGIFQDVIIGNDTIRIYSIHLASMGLDDVPDSGIFTKAWAVSKKLMSGAEKRSRQLDQVVAHIENCPYQYLICGDLNETPYSYNYYRLRSVATDAFIDEGRGFGLTFHSLWPVARIDYQFYSEGITAEFFTVDESMRISDHMPVRGRYRLRK